MTTTFMVLTLVSGALVLLKVAWNLVVPYSLALRHLKGESSPSTSLFPVELVLVVVSALLAIPVHHPVATPLRVFLCGAALVALSYVHFFVAGYLLHRFMKGKSDVT